MATRNFYLCFQVAVVEHDDGSPPVDIVLKSQKEKIEVKKGSFLSVHLRVPMCAKKREKNREPNLSDTNDD